MSDCTVDKIELYHVLQLEPGPQNASPESSHKECTILSNLNTIVEASNL